MPGDDVEGGVVLGHFEEVSGEFARYVPCGCSRGLGVVFFEGGDGDLEVARVGEAVGACGA